MLVGLTAIEAVVSPVFHWYESAPEAIKVVDVFSQIETSNPAST